MSTNSIPVSYTGFRSTASAVGAYIEDWKLAAKASYTLEDLLTPGFLGSAGCCDLPRRRTQRNQRRDNCRRRFQRWS